MQVQYFSSIQLEFLESWVYFNPFRSYPCKYSDWLNECWLHPTHPSFLELAPVHASCRAGWRHVAFTIPSSWRKLGAERKTEMRPLPGIKASTCLSTAREVLSQRVVLFPDRMLPPVYKKEDSHISFDWAVCVAVNSGKCLPGLSWVAWVQHRRLPI